MIFVDTSAWYALIVPNAECHQQVRDCMRTPDLSLITTDHVVDEVLTLLRVRRQHARIPEAINLLANTGTVSLRYTDEPVFREAVGVFQEFSDKGWSFTDCVSYVVIRRLMLETAVSLNHHFRQFGICRVVPEL